MKVDVVKILIDYESEEELREACMKDRSIKIQDYLRYSSINCSLAVSANCARNARWLKPSLGKHAYTV